MESYLSNIQKKIVEVKVVCRPTEEPQQNVVLSPSSVQPQSEKSFKRDSNDPFRRWDGVESKWIGLCGLEFAER